MGKNDSMSEVPRVDAAAPSEAVEEALREYGCVVVERLAPVEQLDRIEAELDLHIRETAPGADEFAGHNTRRTGSLLARSPSFRDQA